MPPVYRVPHLPMLGKGSLFVDILDAVGSPTGYNHFGNVMNIDQEDKIDKAILFQHINKTPSKIAQAAKKRDLTLKIVGTDFKASNLAVVLAASGVTTLNTGTTPVTGEALASAAVTKKGKYFQTVGRNLDPATIVVKQGVTVLVLNTDYEIADPDQGLIYFPLTSGLNNANAVTIDYTPLGAVYSQVEGSTQPFVKAKLRFAPDPTDGQKIGVEWWKVNLTPSGKFSLITDDYGNWELEGDVLDDTVNHPNNPYYEVTVY